MEVEVSDLLQQLNEAMSNVVERVRRSLVEIRNGRGAGAGTIWRADGIIVTNAHVVGRQGFQVVLADGQKLAARLLAQDRDHDLAVLSVEATGLPAIEAGNSRELKPGQWVLAMGHPWGVAGAVTAGAVIDVGIPVEQSPARGEFIQVGLPLRPGHSGGPLVDTQGRLVGLNTMISGPGVGLAIPQHVIKIFLDEVFGEPSLVFI